MLDKLWESWKVPSMNAVFYRDGRFEEIEFESTHGAQCARVEQTGVLSEELTARADIGTSSLAQLASA